ncbi:antitoxin [Streptomyces sulphureus]|uniref:antitoxin n=1 Tax=Streptomyces sulphureus TaxID=47758 RepID=UPI001FDF3481|nr:antitoxin [Streptomyces sulphureus]
MDKVKSALQQHGDKVQQGVDKAADMADSRTQGKYSDQIKSGAQKAKDAAGKYADEGKDGQSGGERGKEGEAQRGTDGEQSGGERRGDGA